MFDLFFFTVNEMVSTGPLVVAFHKSRFIVATAATKFFSTEKCKKSKETFNQGSQRKKRKRFNGRLRGNFFQETRVVKKKLGNSLKSKVKKVEALFTGTSCVAFI